LQFSYKTVGEARGVAGSTPATGAYVEIDQLPNETRADILSHFAERLGVDERDLKNDLFGLADPLVLPVRQVPLGDVQSSKQTSAAAVHKYAAMTSEAPPVLLNGNKLVEGGHRFEAAKKRGEQTIPAVDISQLEAMDWQAWRNGEINKDFPTASNQATRAGQVDSPRLQFSYKNTPDSLMGFPREGPTKPFEQQNYRHVQPVEVTFADGTSHVDAVKGLNREHAMERARRNWPGATIEPVSMQRLQLSRARGMPDGGKLPITDAPPVVPIPQVTVARHPGGMVEGLRQWLVSAKDDLLTRLKAKSPDAITADFDKLKQYKSGENALHHFQAVAALPELYEHSRVAAIQPDRKDATSGMRYERRYAWATFPDGKRRHVLITSRLFHEANKPTKVYSLETMEVEVREAPLTYTDSAARETTKPFDQGAHPVKDGVSVHEFLAGVKPEHRAAPSNNGAVPLSARVKNTAKVAQEAARLLNQQLPGIVHDKVDFHANPEELLKSGYAGEHTFTPEEIADMQNAEAFFDTRTGHTIIFTDHIDVRPGESERAAVARVILHERVGHDGFNHLYERSPEFAGTWGKLSKQIPDTELSTIAADYPHLAGDKGQLALEWFARQVERIAGERAGAKMEPGLKGLLKQMWEALKTLYTHVFAPFSQSLRTERDLRDLIDKATDAARNGTAIPTTAEGLRLQFSMRERLWHKEGDSPHSHECGELLNTTAWARQSRTSPALRTPTSAESC
jgi:hypothetical protein